MKRWQFWLGVLISVAFLWWALRGLRLADIWEVVRHARVVWLVPGVAVYFLAVWARAWRWHYLLRPLKAIPTRSMFPIVCIGYMGNNIYPARAGELLRAYVLRRRQAIPISASLATILVERVFDGVVMLGFVFLNLGELAGLNAYSGFIGSIEQVAIWGAVIFLAAVAAFLLMAALPERSARLIGWFIDRLIPERMVSCLHVRLHAHQGDPRRDE